MATCRWMQPAKLHSPDVPGSIDDASRKDVELRVKDGIAI
jgi:hypothetical protein